MSKMKTWLSALLLMQLALAVGLYWNTQNELQKNLPKPLVDIDWQTLSRVVISDANNHVTLDKGDNGWRMSERGNVPTIKGNAEILLEKLKSLQTSWPVASTSASHERFEVTEDKAERQVAFYQGDKLLGKLIVGSSPGLRKLHVRMADENNVYAVPLELTDMITSEQSWLDRGLLFNQSVQAIQGNDYSLRKTGDQWQLAAGTDDTQATAELDPIKVADMVYALQHLEVRKLITDAPDLAGSGYAQLSVTLAGSDKPLTYQFYQTKETCYVTRSDYEAMFTIGWGDYEKIAEVNLEKLTMHAPQQEGTGTAEESGTAEGNGNAQG
ncbi:MAG: DUF4340 domain-containing protein [Porticoccaceae bacterium]